MDRHVPESARTSAPRCARNPRTPGMSHCRAGSHRAGRCRWRSPHAEFAHAEIDIVAVALPAVTFFDPFPQGLVGVREVSRPADQLRQHRAIGVQRHLRSLARGDHRAFRLQLADQRAGICEAIRQIAAHSALTRRRARGMLVKGANSASHSASHCSRGFCVPGGIDVVGHSKGGWSNRGARARRRFRPRPAAHRAAGGVLLIGRAKPITVPRISGSAFRTMRPPPAA